jgi:hypothetical protein
MAGRSGCHKQRLGEEYTSFGGSKVINPSKEGVRLGINQIGRRGAVEGIRS